MAPYLPTRGGPLIGLVLVFVFGLAGAVVLAFVSAVTRELGWLALIAAGVFGVAIGMVAGTGARLVKLRRPGKVSAVTAAAGLTGAVLHLYFSYRIAAFRFLPVEALTFLEYLDLRCAAGSKIGSIELGYTGTLLYLLAEVPLVVFFAADAATWRLDEPFRGSGRSNWARFGSTRGPRYRPPRAAARQKWCDRPMGTSA